MECVENYRGEITNRLLGKYKYSSRMEVPRLVKITLNMGIGESARDKSVLPKCLEELALIGGQKPIISRARKSVAGFNIRQGWPVGCKVTLRRVRMYRFWHRLIYIVIPRIRDFRGFSSNSFDGRGNYSFGIKEHIVFPEIDYDKVDKIRGLDVCVTTSTRSGGEAERLFRAFGFPLDTVA